MSVKIGYLLPTRENIMNQRPEGALLLELAEQAEALRYDSLWVGDSLLARPRHEPITLLAGVAGRTRQVSLGTAVLLPALRNPVVLAHQIATLDQVSAGRVILGVGIAADVPPVRAEFEAAGVPYEKRVGRLLEGLRLCRALWTGEPVSWDGRWKLDGQQLGPTPHQTGGPPVWLGTSSGPGLERAGKYFEGWFPTGPGAPVYGERWQQVQDAARSAGRDASALTAAVYLTVYLDDDTERAEQTVNQYLERYYSVPAKVMREHQAVYAGPAEALPTWLQGYVDAGAQHIIIRFAGEHEHHLELVSQMRNKIA